MIVYKFILSVTLIVWSFVLNAQQYSRVVSLAPSVTQNIYYLNAQSSLVGCTSYCTIAKDDGKTVVASPVTVYIEKVVSVKPDLVIASTITNPEYIEMLRKFNIRVEVFATPKSFDGICNQFIEMGRLLDKEESATKMVSNITKELDEIKTKRANISAKKIFIQIGADPLYAVIPNIFMNDYILFANATNVAKNLTKATVSRETVITKNPDYIFIVTMGIIGEKEKKVWESFKDLNAVKNNKIFIIDSDLACTPTPQTFLKAMKIITKHLNE
ncbi:MAG: helical backbone metal receptor [Bacteroidota bacterium]|nr:helical backbone metal receptor [Bacteroidota bacterium]